MAVKDGHTPDDGVGEIHDDVDGAAIRNIDRVQPHGIDDWPVVFGVREKMDLMYVHWMQFPSSIHNSPVLICSDLHVHHLSGVRRKFFLVYVKAILIFR